MLEIDYSNMMSDVIGEAGLTGEDFDTIEAGARKAHEEISGRKRPGFAFLDLPEQDVSALKEMGGEVREGSRYYLHLGIGGSALGPRTILEALSPFHNYLRSPKVFIYDNVDPCTLENILSLVDLSRTAVNVVTKSGSTAETMASYMVMHEKLGGRAEPFLATTDPEKGYLRKMARDSGMRALPVPPEVGGRYSVLTPVGLLLAEVIGVGADALLAGAREMREHCREADLERNPAYLFGAMLYLMDARKRRNINVMLPYADRLKPLSEWFCQLWAESLGKEGKGSTPYPSLGTTDQHSQLQLWMQGPSDKVITFLRIGDCGTDVPIPRVFEDTGFGYLGGHSLAELITAEEESTELCLAGNGRPNMTITVPVVDAAHLGQLFLFFELATAFAGCLYGVNAFNQPGVEEGKNFTYGMMGREGYGEKRAEVLESRKKKVWKA
jgi:glucose-6-phosphate isomerase